VAAADAVITTAVIPGEKPPVLIDPEMVAAMRPGSLIVDLAAERGGNCALSRPDEVVVEHGVTILGPTDLPATVPFDSSQMYAKNVTAFLLALVKDGELALHDEDEIVQKTMVLRDGEVTNARVRALLERSTGTPHGPAQGSEGRVA
jgi:NAD(P) transhydrogenase subunit alpha